MASGTVEQHCTKAQGTLVQQTDGSSAVQGLSVSGKHACTTPPALVEASCGEGCGHVFALFCRVHGS